LLEIVSPFGRFTPKGEIMPVANPLPIHLRPCREKVFGEARGIPLDRNAKARIIAYAKGYKGWRSESG
jgi:hypothetical protein